jgi:hypothetical protein
MPVKKVLDDLHGAQLLFIPFFTVIGEQGQEDACLLNAVKGKRSEKTVVQLEFDPNLIPELLQSPVGRVIHGLIGFV